MQFCRVDVVLAFRIGQKEDPLVVPERSGRGLQFVVVVIYIDQFLFFRSGRPFVPCPVQSRHRGIF